MLKLLAVIFSGVLVAAGLCDAVHIVRLFFLKPHKKPGKLLVLFPQSGYAHQQILLALNELYWHGGGYADAIMVITSELEPKEKELCIEYFQNEKIFFAENTGELKSIYKRF